MRPTQRANRIVSLICGIVLAVGLTMSAYSCATAAPRVHTQTRRSEISLDANSALVREAWSTAKSMANLDRNWLQPSEIVRINMLHPQKFGEYFWYIENRPDGTMGMKEQILLYIPVESPGPLLRNVLIHEFLHAIYTRLCIEAKRTPMDNDSEIFVCARGGCEEKPWERPYGGKPTSPSEDSPQ